MSWLGELLSILLKLVVDILILLLMLLLKILLILSPIIIIVVIVYIVKRKKAIKVENEKKRMKEIEDKKRREFDKKAERVYAENLSRLYDNRSTSELIKIYKLLQVMHYNAWDFNDWSNHNATTASAYCDAKDKLLMIMGNPTWKRLCRNGKLEYNNSPVYVTTDMNYVYRVLRSRGVTDW